MRILVILLAIFLGIAQSASLFNSNSGDVHVSGSFRVAGENEEISSNSQDFQEVEHPFFQLEAMKIARAYLDKQYAKERAQNN